MHKILRLIAASSLLFACAAAQPTPVRSAPQASTPAPQAAAAATAAAPAGSAGDAAACEATPGAPLAAPGSIAKVDGDTAKALVANGARLVDVRKPDFFARGHIEGAVNIPVAEVAQRAAEIGPPGTHVILYCRTGAGSSQAAATLQKLGYKSIYDLGSYLNWGEGAPAATPLPPAQ